MLTLRQPQCVALMAADFDALVETGMQMVATHWPSVARRSEASSLRTRLLGVFQSAWALGLTTRGQHLRYLNVCLALGDDFDAAQGGHPEARAIVRGPGRAAERLERLVTWAATHLQTGGGRL